MRGVGPNPDRNDRPPPAKSAGPPPSIVDRNLTDPAQGRLTVTPEIGGGGTSLAWRTRLLRVAEAADYLAISRSKLYCLIDAKKIDSVKTGGSRRVTLGALVDYVEGLQDRSSG